MQTRRHQRSLRAFGDDAVRIGGRNSVKFWAGGMRSRIDGQIQREHDIGMGPGPAKLVAGSEGACLHPNLRLN